MNIITASKNGIPTVEYKEYYECENIVIKEDCNYEILKFANGREEPFHIVQILGIGLTRDMLDRHLAECGTLGEMYITETETALEYIVIKNDEDPIIKELEIIEDDVFVNYDITVTTKEGKKVIVSIMPKTINSNFYT